MSDNRFSKGGYSEGDHYVAKHEAEKLQELRDKRAAKKAEEEKKTHWMKCPKCGSDMEEIELVSGEMAFVSKILTRIQQSLGGQKVLDLLDQTLLDEMKATKDLSVWPCPSPWRS